MESYWTIVNRAAGGGRCAKQVDDALARLRAGGLELAVRHTTGPEHATQLTREGLAQGHRRFISVGGDGTSFEVINGLFSGDEGDGLSSRDDATRPTLGILPLGTGNSFLRDFGIDTSEKAIRALLSGVTRPCDVVRCTSDEGMLHFINLFSVGFTADAGALTNRRFKPFGAFGYILATLACLVRIRYPVFCYQADDEAPRRDPCTLLSFSNSRFTGGTMMMAPHADVADGALDIVRIPTLSRLRFLRTFPKIFKGTHVDQPRFESTRARRVTFDLDGPVDAMIDGEIRRLQPHSLEVLPGALEVIA